VKRAGLTPWLVGSTVIQRYKRFWETSSEDEDVCRNKPRGGEKNFAELFIYLAISQIPPGPTHVTQFRAVTRLDSEHVTLVRERADLTVVKPDDSPMATCNGDRYQHTG